MRRLFFPREQSLGSVAVFAPRRRHVADARGTVSVVAAGDLEWTVTPGEDEADVAQAIDTNADLINRLIVEERAMPSEPLLRVASMRRLRLLALRRQRVTRDVLTAAVASPELASLHAWDSDLGDEDAVALRDARQVRRLNLSVTKVTDDVFEIAASMPALEWLQLADMPLPGRSLRSLRRASCLRMLNLSGTSLTDETCSYLADSQLEMFVASGTNITDDSVRTLARMPRLGWLRISHNAITDASLRALAEMPLLRHLQCEATEVTEEGLAWLRRRRPDLVVNGAAHG